MMSTLRCWSLWSNSLQRIYRFCTYIVCMSCVDYPFIRFQNKLVQIVQVTPAGSPKKSSRGSPVKMKSSFCEHPLLLLEIVFRI